MAKRSSRNKKQSRPDPSAAKRRLLERVAALLHNDPRVHIELNDRLKAREGQGRTREIDILLSGKVSGYPVYVAIECKNFGKKIGVEQVDSFIAS